MPYNTRRKSLSLPSLGIHLPTASRSGLHRSPPAPATAEQPPSKRAKRSHSSASPTPELPTKPATTQTDRPKVYEHTPPPSPGTETETKIDLEGINDEIVVAVIQQLEKTGNKPHLIKELAAVLSKSLAIVESSANPSSIINSRLNAYVRRPWTALAPCPLIKTTTTTHPRRIYFHLSTLPAQPFPELVNLSELRDARIISPSLSSHGEANPEDEEDERDARRRVAMSPSPEVDLSSPELDDDDGPATPADEHLAHNHRAASPPLEGDEREFTQTASNMQMRQRSESHDGPQINISEPEATDEVEMLEAEENENDAAAELRNSEAAAALFGSHHGPANALSASGALTGFAGSSPVVRPQMPQAGTLNSGLPMKKLNMELDLQSEVGLTPLGESAFGYGWDMRSPEKVELAELDDWLGGL